MSRKDWEPGGETRTRSFTAVQGNLHSWRRSGNDFRITREQLRTSNAESCIHCFGRFLRHREAVPGDGGSWVSTRRYALYTVLGMAHFFEFTSYTGPQNGLTLILDLSLRVVIKSCRWWREKREAGQRSGGANGEWSRVQDSGQLRLPQSRHAIVDSAAQMTRGVTPWGNPISF